MTAFILIFTFIFGAIVGSFLNVVILRYGTEKPISHGRSGCPDCGKVLHWHELIPIWSFFALGGKCAVCSKPISLQYPLVEAFTGFIFAATVYYFGLSTSTAYYLFIESILIVIAVYDFHHKIIPDFFVFLFAVAAFIMAFVQGWGMWDILAGPILAAPFALLWLVSRGRWIGLGDSKLALGIGFFLGLAQGVSAIVLAFWIGAAWSIALMAVQKASDASSRVTMKSEIPFGPFLIAGTLLILFFGWDVLGISLLLNTI